MAIQSVPLEKSFRLINHGPTVLVSASHAGDDNVMAAAWACALDFAPPKVMVVLDKATYTRGLIEKSGWFALQVPTVPQAGLVLAMGESRHDHPHKLRDHGVELFRQPGFELPLVAGCSAWLACRLVPEAHNQQTYDLFIGEVKGAWADDRVFRHGHWIFDEAPDELRSLHYVAGGQFYTTGRGIKLPGVAED